jgi:hypothetical protein
MKAPELRAQVSREERAARTGHGPAVVVLVGADVRGRAAFAAALERHLFDRGVGAVALAGNADYSMTVTDQARALSLAGLVPIVGGDGRTSMVRAQPGTPVVSVHVERESLYAAAERVIAATRGRS